MADVHVIGEGADMLDKLHSLFAPKYPKGYVGRHRARYALAFPLGRRG